MNGIQFLLCEESIHKFVEEEHKEEATEELTREEKADLEVCESSCVAEEVSITETEAEVTDEEGTSGGYFDLLPVSSHLKDCVALYCSILALGNEADEILRKIKNVNIKRD